MAPLSVVVNANVVDIKTDNPRASDQFLVDSNVWYWMTYTRSSFGQRSPLPYQTRFYPNYVNSAIKVNASIYRCGLSFSELGHRIENNELDIFLKTTSQACTLKEFRHNFSSERSNVIAEIELAWQQVEQYTSKSIDVLVTDSMINNAINRIKSTQLDVYDLFMIEAMLQNGVPHIITDDCDFATVQGITVFTANRTAIEAARAQSKLIKR